MSQYLNMYFKIGDNYLSAGNFSRSSKMYELFVNFVPYEDLLNITKTRIGFFIEEINEEMQSTKEDYDKNEKKKALIATFNNNVEDKMSAIEQIDETLSYLKEKIGEYTYVTNVLIYWNNLIDEEEWNNPETDTDTILWGGIEARPPKKES